MSSLNSRLREILAAEELKSPGSRAHAQRVSVYAVAVGDRLGLDFDSLLRLRVAAELASVRPIPPNLAAEIAVDSKSTSIVALCGAFDRMRTGYGGGDSVSDADCLVWLQSEALKVFDEVLVSALAAVQALIQPVGT